MALKKRDYLIVLNRLFCNRRNIVKNILKYFNDPSDVFSASGGVLTSEVGLPEDVIHTISRAKPHDIVRIEREQAQKHNAHIVTVEDDSYPKWLLNIYDPPLVLYTKGKLCERDEISLSVVGCRKVSCYGKQVAEDFGLQFAKVGITVISGMARGVDTCAHKGAIIAKGRTVAVLGCGIDIVYPPENRRLVSQIAQYGAVVSEFPVGTPPYRYNFPQRNRIISGLSFGVVVVEAGKRSGSLITADFALEQGKEVYAVPGNITSPNSKGTNKLIKEGAKPVTSAQDIIDDVVLFYGACLSKPEFDASFEAQRIQCTDEESKLLKHISCEPAHVDDIIAKMCLPASTILARLAQLELKGFVRQVEGKRYITTFESGKE